MTKEKEAIVTGAAAAIVTALGEGPCSALVLSQRLNVTHANARQTLRRLADRGVVTKLRRGLYGLGCDSGHCDTTTSGSALKAAKPCAPIVTRKPWAGPPAARVYTEAVLANAVAGAWAHFEAMDDPMRQEAWA